MNPCIDAIVWLGVLEATDRLSVVAGGQSPLVTTQPREAPIPDRGVPKSGFTLRVPTTSLKSPDRACHLGSPVGFGLMASGPLVALSILTTWQSFDDP
jgi:hypothetical protein